MSKIEQLPFYEPIIGFDIVDTGRHDLWFFLSAKNLFIRKVNLFEKKPNLHEQLTVNCYPGKEAETGLTNCSMLVVTTSKDIHVLISTSVFHVIKISLSDLAPVVMQGHLAPISEIIHVKDEFAITTSHDNSVNGWDLEKGTLAFKYAFLYFHPVSIISAVDNFNIRR